MFVNRILAKSTRQLVTLRAPMRAFFTSDKTAPETASPQQQNVEEAKESTQELRTVKLSEFSEDELKPTRLSYKSILRSIEPYKQHNQSVYERLSSEVENLYKDKDAIPALRQEIRALEEVNKLNHEKLVKAVDRIKSAEQETLDIEARLSKEIDKCKTYAISKFSSEVLEIIDNLELCTENALKDKDKNKAVIESDFYQGIDLTYKHALSLFKRYGITQIEEGVGHKMDPNVHDVLFIAKDEKKLDGEIIHVAKRGYRLGDRVLRASKVGVVRND